MYDAIKIEGRIWCGSVDEYFAEYKKALDEINSKNGTIIKVDVLDSGEGYDYNRCCIITYKID